MSFPELERLVARSEKNGYIAQGLLPAKQIAFLLGDSGLGKSPLVLQLALCVASGLPFLGRTVTQGKVLYVDFENGLCALRELVARLSEYLGLTAVPNGLQFWNIHSCPGGWHAISAGLRVPYGLEHLVMDFQPELVVIDSLSGFRPDMEKDTQHAIEGYQDMRRLTRKYGCSFLLIVHPKKPSSDPQAQLPPLENADIRRYFDCLRGASALVNAADGRLAVQRPALWGIKEADGPREEAALLLRGFQRISGEIPAMYISRLYGPDGEPTGYAPMSALRLLNNADQQRAYEALPLEFDFKTAKHIYGRADEATSTFLKKCIAACLLEKEGRGRYVKVRGGEGGVRGNETQGQ